MLLRVRSEDPRERARALDVVLAVYWQPVFRHVRARWRLGGPEAEDAAQGFFAAALEKGWLERFDPARGRFRSYLLACLDGHVAHELRAAAALKRGGGATFVPLETRGDDGEVRERPLPDAFDPDASFQREWARSVFARALATLESRCVEAGKPLAFAVFLRCDVEGAEAGERPSYARLAEEFALSVAQVTNHLHWVRRELRAVVLETLREITAGEQEFRAEVRALLGIDPP